MDISKERLQAMLGGAKQVMDKVNGTDFKVDHTRINETLTGNVELLDSLPNGATPQTNPTREMGHSYQNLEKSKMPEAIKRAMVETPIPKFEMSSGGGPTFSLNDVKNLVKPQMAPQVQTQTQIPNQNNHKLNETTIVNSKGQMLITMTEAELDKKIQDKLLDFMATTFTKNLTENTIKRTISTLIKEGKIKVKQKTTK
tara:strand:+ start:4094 stop:4690 length:597 start_codon:yes stop_codon:yes gene_type:complete